MAKQRRSYCCVPGCTTAYKKNKLSLFSIPKDSELRNQWENVIPPSDKVFDKYSAVCELHFKEEFILRNYTQTINGETISIPRGLPMLKPEAVPTIFQNVPKYVLKNASQKRTLREIAHCDDEFSDVTVKEENIPEGFQIIEPEPVATTIFRNAPKSNVSHSGKLTEIAYSDDELSNATVAGEHVPDDVSMESFQTINLPSHFWGKQMLRNNPKCMIFHVHTLGSGQLKSLITEKLILVTEKDSHFSCEIYLRGLKVKSIEDITSKEMLQDILDITDKVLVCKGAGSVEEFKDMNHVHKVVIFSENVYSKECRRIVTEGFICLHCKYLRRTLLHYIARIKRRRKYPSLKAIKQKNEARTIKKLRTDITSLELRLRSIQKRNKFISEVIDQ